jgi:hypothetical protein
MTPEYVTVYQISKASADWSFALAGGIPLVIGIVLILGKRRFGWKKPNWLFPVSACAFGVLWLATAGFSVMYSGSKALEAFRKGDYWLVEGVVTDFKPMPYEGHTMECFSVQEERFCYSDYVITPGFRNTASHGGPIRDGLPVRIADRGGVILRLEIPKDQVRSPAEIVATTSAAENASQTRVESDPVVRRMMLAFLFTMMCWTLWWNVQWRRAIRLWVRPAHHPLIEYALRIFFALNFVGAVWQFVKQIRVEPLERQEIVPTIEIAGAMCVVVAVMTLVVLWRAERRDRKEFAAIEKKPYPGG